MTARSEGHPSPSPLPPIIQGGMGIGISGWRLARAVSLRGQLGVVSGVAADTLLVRGLQAGDPDGHLRRAIRAFPIPGIADELLARYLCEGGLPDAAPYRLLALYSEHVSPQRERAAVVAGFVEVFLAKEGHPGLVGLNLLTKVQASLLPTLYGAMLAGVDCVLMGAGIPREIPRVLDRLAEHQPVSIRLEVAGDASAEPVSLGFEPGRHLPEPLPALKRPRFLPIVASNSLATMLARKSDGRIDGFVIEGPTAGGHNAPPRGAPRQNDRGEPLYGPRDEVDLAGIRALGLPFWVAGGKGSPGALRAALEAGASGVQVGTLFAYCAESGLREDLKTAVLRGARERRVEVRTDARASPTGYPFKVVELEGLPSGDEGRERICDLGYLRTAYRMEDGRIGYRCPGEPVESYVAKGGRLEDTVGRRCLCNALLANVGFGQRRSPDHTEAPLLTSGDGLRELGQFLGARDRYAAGDVVDHLLGAEAPKTNAPDREV